jgi:tRNA threonylcarbamoyladenosine biosynthesis protein TsaB
MSIILSIETATKAGSVAIHKDGALIGIQQYNIEKSHSALVQVLMLQMLENTGIERNEIDAVAVSAGPGSYTGLRIGVSSAKGFCYALNLPLIAINTLEAMAFQVNKQHVNEYLLCPMIDARRLEVYCLVAEKSGKILEATYAKIIEEDAFSTYLNKGKVLFFGDGADKCKTIIRSENAIFIDNIIPSAKEIGEMAEVKFQKGDFEDLAYYEPFYLKEFRIAKPKVKA